MNPINGPNNKETCPQVTSSNCTIWNGPDLACINLCKGDTVSDVTAKIAEKLCDLIDDLDLNDLDLKCIFEACVGCPAPEKSVKNVITLLINKVCSLEDIIETCCEGSTGNINIPVFDVNLKCLAVTDGSGNVLNDDTNDEIVQTIIDRVCDHETRITTLEGTVDDLQDQIDALSGSSGSTTPSVTSDCLFVGTKFIDDAFEDLDSAFCTHRTSVGDTTKIAQAIAQQCAGLGTLFPGNPNFTASPANLADSVKNIWLLACNLLSRINSIETTCCQATCDDVKVGFIVDFNQDNTINLRFTSGAGTSIPAGFVDCGSTLTISDESGHQAFADNLAIANNSTTVDIDVQGLDLGDKWSFSLTVKMCNASQGLNCEKCVTKTVQTSTNSNLQCSVCEICATVGTGDITINYIHESTLVSGSIVILVGNCANVYSYMVVQSISQTGAGAISNIDCLNYPLT